MSDTDRIEREQLVDDPALNLRAVWLGPKQMRWPFDATFTEWRVALAGSIVATLALFLVLPAFIPLAVAGYALATFTAGMLFPQNERTARAAVLVLWALLCLLAVPHPLAWLTPMPLLLAVISGIGVSIYFTKRVARWITPERPVAYWRSLPSRAAAGPRQGPARTFDASPLALTAHAPFREPGGRTAPLAEPATSTEPVPAPMPQVLRVQSIGGPPVLRRLTLHEPTPAPTPAQGLPAQRERLHTYEEEL